MRPDMTDRYASYSSRGKPGYFDFISSTWPKAFFFVTVLQLLICLAIESYTFAQFHLNISNDHNCNGVSCTPLSPDVAIESKTISTFLALFIFGFIFELYLVWDALRLKNTIQIIIICIANVAFLAFSALQPTQIQEAIANIKDKGSLDNPDLGNHLRPFLIALPCIIAAVTALMCFISWKLYQQFSWDILKHIGADYRMKKRFLAYQIYIALLKVDFFFFLGFTVQFLVIVNKQDFELGLTIAAIPFCVIVLILASYLTRRENTPGSAIIIVLYFAALGYFVFKLVRIYQTSHANLYRPVRKSLTTFAVLTILLIVLTIVNAFMCMLNFGHGLKRHLVNHAPSELEKPDLNSIDLNLVKTQLPSRMTID